MFINNINHYTHITTSSDTFQLPKLKLSPLLSLQDININTSNNNSIYDIFSMQNFDTPFRHQQLFHPLSKYSSFFDNSPKSKHTPSIPIYTLVLQIPQSEPLTSSSQIITQNTERSKRKKKINVLLHPIIDGCAFQCLYCGKIFKNGCGLGGHMSRVHPHKSERYKKKQRTREKRNEYRESIVEAKIQLCKKYLMDYNDLIKNKKGKQIIKNLIQKYKKEYTIILRNIKYEKGLL